MNTGIKTQQERDTGIRRQMLDMSWSYLRDNFHKFSDTNKIKIALELVKKDIPQEFTGTMNCVVMPTIKTSDGKDLNFNVGVEPEPVAPTDAGSPGEAAAPNNEV